MSHADSPEVTAATFCATLVDEWVRGGVRFAVVAPGSRSTPLALALAGDPRMQVEVHQDERSAAFMALGVGLSTRRPAIVITTSGTAAVELHSAIVEAHQAGVPLIACTADRPPELRDVGAPQTVDQTHLFGHSVRWFHDPGVPDAATRDSWRSIAARSVAEALGSPPGPVHLNLPFRDPLIGRAGELPEGRPAGAPWHEANVAARRVDRHHLDVLARQCKHRDGVIVAGHGIDDPAPVFVLAHALGWPVLADPRSGCRIPDAVTIAHFDSILRAVGNELTPEVALRLGEPPASKVVREWLARSAPMQIAVEAHGVWFDADRSARLIIDAEPSIVCRELAALVDDGRPTAPWLTRWAEAERRAATAIGGSLAHYREPTEPAIARDAVEAVPEGGALVVSSSMPVRDVEWYAAPREALEVHANRGANGIDGVVSTAVGVALGSGRPTIALVGDLAFIHDSNGLLRAGDRAVDLVIVVVDNDGGGIFSFLPQATAVDPARFEQLFGTAHDIDVADLARAFRAPVELVDEQAELGTAIEKAVAQRGLRVLVVRTDRAVNVEVHDAIHRSVARSLDDLAGS